MKNRMRTSNSRFFLNTLFNCLDEERIPYCILHSHETIPEYARSDLDMTIDPQQRNKLDNLLQKVAKEWRFAIVQKIHHDLPYCCYYGLLQIDSPTMYAVKLDFLIDEFGLNKYCISSKTLLEGRIRYKSFYVPSYGSQAVYLLIKRAVKEKFLDIHIKKLQELYITDTQAVAQSLDKYFSRPVSLEAISAINAENRTKMSQLMPRLRGEIRNIWGKNFIKRVFWSARRMMTRVLHPTGELIAILSPDGGGKTSTAKAMLKALIDGFWKIEYLHWRPGFLPRLRSLLGEPVLDNMFFVTNPHSSKRRSSIISFFRWLYYSVDYVVGFYSKILPMKIRTTAIVMDRYYYDIIVDPIRYGFNLPKWILKSIVPLIPKPDLTIYLDNDADVLRERKNELSIKELKRQVDAWRQYIPSLPNARVVTTNRSLDDVVDEVTKLVLERRADMTRKMLEIDPVESLYLWKSDFCDGYVALPSKKHCRWIVPVSATHADGAWSLYLPYSRAGRSYKGFLRYMSAKGLLGLLKTKKLDLGLIDHSEALKRRAETIFQRSDLISALSSGTRGPFRKITMSIIASNGDVLGYAKIGESARAVERVRYEAMILRELSDRAHGKVNGMSVMGEKLVIPKCLFEGEVGRVYVLIQSPGPFDGKSGGSEFNQEYAGVLNTLAESTTVKIKFRQSDFYRQLNEGVSTYPLSYKSILVEGMDNLVDKIGSKDMTFALSHGDFVPWNMLWNRDSKCFLFDWESACLEAPAGIDLVHFLFQTGFLLKKYRNRKLLDFLLDKGYYQILSDKTGIKAAAPSLLVLIYLLRMAISEDREQILSKSAVERRNLIRLILSDVQTR